MYTPPSSLIDKSLLDQSFKNDKLYSTDLNTCSILYTKKKKASLCQDLRKNYYNVSNLTVSD